MAGGGGGGLAWSRRLAARMRSLRGLVRDTQRAMHDVTDILNIEPDIQVKVQDIGTMSSRPTALVILGTSPDARARLVHALLGRQLLPLPAPSGCRWLRIVWGSTTSAHLTLAYSEFELVDELECSRRHWDIIPQQDLLRQDPHDLSTMLEIELNNAFLKDGLKIIVPPDLPSEPGPISYHKLKEQYSELYQKRDCFLRNYNQVYLYAIDRTGNIIFNENISSGVTPSGSEEDFWSTFNLYHSKTTDRSCDYDEAIHLGSERRDVKDFSGSAVFAAENCLDLQQMKEIEPASQLLFVLFADSPRLTPAGDRGGGGASDATESMDDYTTEELPESDQELLRDVNWKKNTAPSLQNKADRRRLVEQHTAFMNELLDQWELMSPPSAPVKHKHYVKSQWTILDDAELCRHQTDVKPLSGPTIITNASATQKDNDKIPSTERGCVEDDTVLKSRTTFLSKVVKFATESVHTHLLDLCTKLSEVHIKLLQQFILASFDLARELQVVPKKVEYVALKEQELYKSINEKFSSGDKKQELVTMMDEVLRDMRADVLNMDWSVDDLPCHQYQRSVISNSMYLSCSQNIVPTECEPPPPPPDLSADTSDPSDGEEAEYYHTYEYNFDDFEIIHSNEHTLSELCTSRSEDEEEDMGSLASLAQQIPIVESSRSRWSASANASVVTCSSGGVSVKQASLDVQHTVLSKLSRKISERLVKFVDCLKEAYFGTLHRCLESLEWSCREELGGRPATTAMRHLAAVARQVDLTPCASFSLLQNMLDSIRRLFSRLSIVGGGSEGACCVLSPVWRRQVALHTLNSLSAHRLARVISVQILERLNTAHERYQSALGTLDSALAGRLHHTENVKLAIRKKYAPLFARLCLESTSMCDLLMYGTPELGREIGRGQYGVVYGVRGSWAGGGQSPLAVKSVLPTDERHYHELAMEFFYTRSIPAHPRIVRLFGSIVQRYGAGAGGSPTVLLVSERKCRDLHTAVRAGLPLSTRLRISIDIVQGIRYLHSLGLVHRDIKMKNVLLDAANRAALSDLGFCAAEALISGSVVGTPVHMAPELLAGEYDGTVDVYAFGILFWYVCAGNVKLPAAFEPFQNKEQLWSKVRRGLRPERLAHFSDACWEVMQSCWASEPSERALLGDVQPQLEAILEEILANHQDNTPDLYSNGSSTDEDDSLCPVFRCK